MSKNKHIEEYMNYYLGLNVSPEYAILLRGEWGVGKTWFIKNYLERKSDLKYLYVSLNGITTFNEIEDIFFQQLHPVLASKGMKIAGKILKGALKTVINIDINDDGKSDGKVISSIPDINIPDYFKNVDDKLLIFDDLERCSIEIPNIMGYINQFVENCGSKVIILGNESEIINNEDEKNLGNPKRYLTIKEKIIGKSLNIQSDFEIAYDSFINHISDTSTKELLKNKKFQILELYKIANYNNLRHLRQTILDFERFYRFMPELIEEKNDLIEHIIALFFTISFELRKGNIIESEISKLFLIDSLARNKDDPKTIPQEIRDKYPILRVYYHPIQYNAWITYFKLGTLDKEAIKAEIRQSVYFNEENTPAWIKLYRYFDLNDDEFNTLSEQVYQDLKDSKISDKYEILQITGMLTLFSEKNLIPQTKKEIIDIGKLCLNTLNSNSKLVIDKHQEFPSDNSHSLGYHGLDIKEFKKFLDFTRELAINSKINDLPKKANELCAIMKSSYSDFEEQLLLTNSKNNPYYDTPILKHIKINDFVSTFLALPNKDKNRLAYILDNRYKVSEFNSLLIDELDWLIQLEKLLKNEKDSLSGRISGLVMEKSIMPSIRRAIEKLDNTLGNKI